MGRRARFRRAAHAAGARLRARHQARRRGAYRDLRKRPGGARVVCRLRRRAPAARLCDRQRAREALQRFGRGRPRRRDALSSDLDRRRAAARNGRLYQLADGSRRVRDAEGIRERATRDLTLAWKACVQPAECDLSHRGRSTLSLTAERERPNGAAFRGAGPARRITMKGADKVICQAAAVLLLFTVTSAPARAQFGGFGGGGGGGEDMMTQMAPMLEMMKAKMGKRRFAMLMQTMGPMMSQMMQGGGGFGSMGGGGFGGMMPGGMGGYIPGGMMGGMGAGDIMGMMNGYGGGDIMSMIGPLMRMANFGGGYGRRRHHR